MNMTQEERFRRMLRWYPLVWREKNGGVLLGTMLDEADRTGRSGPTLAERLSAAGQGFGMRLNSRLAIGAALSALGVSALAGILTIWAIELFAAANVVWTLALLTIGLGPGLVMIAAIALLRQRGLVSGPRAVALVFMFTFALAAATLAQISWAIGFDLADRNVPLNVLAAAWPWLLGGALTIGAVAIGVLVHALLRHVGLHPVVSTLLAVLAGVLLAPVIGMSLIAPYTAAVYAAAVALVSILPSLGSRRTRVVTASLASSATASPNAVPVRTRKLARSLAYTSTVFSSAGVTYAFTGSSWGGHSDATITMGQGITIALLSALPLIAAVGAIVAASGRIRPLHTWGPLVLVALALVAVAAGYRGAPDWGAMVAGFAIASTFGGAAIAWWSAPRLPGSTRPRVAIAVLIGIVYAAFFGILVAPTLAFALPFLAAVFAIWTPGRPRADAVGKAMSSATGLALTSTN